MLRSGGDVLLCVTLQFRPHDCLTCRALVIIPSERPLACRTFCNSIRTTAHAPTHCNRIPPAGSSRTTTAPTATRTRRAASSSSTRASAASARAAAAGARLSRRAPASPLGGYSSRVSRLVAGLTRLWTKPPHVDRHELVLRSARGAVYLRVPGPERRAARWEAALGALAERSGARAMVARQARGTLLSVLVPRYA